MKKLLISGLGPVLDSTGKPKKVTRKQAQAWGDKKAKSLFPKGFWSAGIFETDGYFRVSICGQKERV